jgi:hypothetical protein
MRLSTSSFELRHRRAAWLLIAGIVAICLATELLSGLLLDRGGLTEQRIRRQVATVQHLHHGDARKRSILMVGNSLLLEALDEDSLKADLGSKFELAPFFIEATSYYDWYYGLRRIFSAGSGPDIVIVGLPAPTFLETQVRADYFSATLLNPKDILRVSRDVHYGRTEMTSLLLGAASRFWGHRGVIRTRALSAIFPNAALLARGLGRSPRAKMTDTEIDERLKSVAPARLDALAEMCRAHGAELVILLPPVSNGNDHLQTFSAIAYAAHAKVLLPVSSATFTARDFYDGLHLRNDLTGSFTHQTALAINSLTDAPSSSAPVPVASQTSPRGRSQEAMFFQR